MVTLIVRVVQYLNPTGMYILGVGGKNPHRGYPLLDFGLESTVGVQKAWEQPRGGRGVPLHLVCAATKPAHQQSEHIVVKIVIPI